MNTRPPPDDDPADPFGALIQFTEGPRDTVEMSADEINAAIAEREKAEAEELAKAATTKK